MSVGNLGEEIIFEGDSKVTIVKRAPTDEQAFLNHCKTEKNVLHKHGDLIKND